MGHSEGICIELIANTNSLKIVPHHSFQTLHNLTQTFPNLHKKPIEKAAYNNNNKIPNNNKLKNENYSQTLGIEHAETPGETRYPKTASSKTDNLGFMSSR